MDGYQVSLPTPDRLPVEGVADRKQGSQPEQHPREKKEKKKKVLTKSDQVILSDKAPVSKNIGKTSEEPEIPNPQSGKGDVVDIKI